MKYSKSQIMSRAYKIPDLKFEDQNLTSFAGLVIFQPLMLGLEMKNRLWHCFRHLNLSRIFGHHIISDAADRPSFAWVSKTARFSLLPR